MKVLLDFSLWQQTQPADAPVYAALAQLRGLVTALHAVETSPVLLALDASRPASATLLRTTFADLLPPAAILTRWQIAGDPLDPELNDINRRIRHCFQAHQAPDVILYPIHEDTPCDQSFEEDLPVDAKTSAYLLSVSGGNTPTETCPLQSSLRRPHQYTLPSRHASIEALAALLHPRPVSNALQSSAAATLLAETCAHLAKCESSLMLEAAWSIANNHRSARRPILYLDISGIVRRDVRTGIERVTRGLVSELLKLTLPTHDIQPVFANDYELGYKHAGDHVARLFNHTLSTAINTPIAPVPGDVFMVVDFDVHITRVQEAYLRYLHLHGLQVWFLVHDLLPVTNPDWFPPGVHEGHSKWLAIISHFTGAVCVSKTVADKFAAWRAQNVPQLLGKPYKIAHSHNAADLKNAAPTYGLPPDIAELVKRWEAHPTFVMVGTVEPRKGYQQVLRAFELLWKTGNKFNLIIVGKQGWHMEEFAEELQNSPHLNQMLFWPSNVSDEFLEKIYASSTCLIAASIDEGFGLPLIEAAMHKLPIIARDIPIFREVAGENAYYFNTTSADGLATALTQWVELHGQGNQPDSTGLIYKTWGESARRLLQVISIST